jgi:hypothetical protein
MTNLTFQATVFLICNIVIIAFMNDQLSRKHPSDVRVVWYLFALAATVSFFLAHWANGYGAIDNTGNFHGRAGSVLNFLLKASLDLQASIDFCLAIVAIVLIPQAVSYVLSGLSGSAAAPIFVGGSVTFFAWGLIKSLAVASGVGLMIPLYSYLHQWSNVTINQLLAMTLVSAMLLAFAFAVLVIYREILHFPTMLRQHLPARFQNLVNVITAWLMRRS